MSYNRRKKPNFPTSPQFTFPSFQSRPLTHTSSLSRRTGPEFQTKILSSSVLFLRFQNSRFLLEVACIPDFPYGTDKTHGICRSAFEAFISFSLSARERWPIQRTKTSRKERQKFYLTLINSPELLTAPFVIFVD